MSKAFISNGAGGGGPDGEEDSFPQGVKNYMTPKGFAAMQEELRRLLKEERPKVVEIVSWAAGNGDRSENGDYLYGKKRLREIDRRVRYLAKRLDAAEVVDPKRQQGLERVFFGATVTFARESGAEQTVSIVGVDEADAGQGKISWQSPVAKALMKRKAGDEAVIVTASGRETVEIVSVSYPLEQ